MDDGGGGKGDGLIPARYQPPLSLERLILEAGAPGAGERMELDVLIVGAGPAGLACAIELARLARHHGSELGIGILEKAGEGAGIVQERLALTALPAEFEIDAKEFPENFAVRRVVGFRKKGSHIRAAALRLGCLEPGDVVIQLKRARRRCLRHGSPFFH